MKAVPGASRFSVFLIYQFLKIPYRPTPTSKTTAYNGEKYTPALKTGAVRLYGKEAKDDVCLLDLILYVPSTIFQLNRDGSSWMEPVLS